MSDTADNPQEGRGENYWHEFAGGMKMPVRPTVVCLCGSARFRKAFEEATLRETLAGRIVLSVGSYKSDSDCSAGLSPEERTVTAQMLAELHRHKIKMADEVLILNVGGYIGESTLRELQFALSLGRKVRYLEEPEQDLP